MRSRVNQKDPRNNNRDGTTQQTRAHSRGMPSSLICRVMSRILKAACYKLINTVLRAPLFLLAMSWFISYVSSSRWSGCGDRIFGKLTEIPPNLT